MLSVLITGASKGIGFETALSFARAGHRVFATMRKPTASPKLAEIAAREGLPIQISAMDVDSDDSVRSGIASILAESPIDVLINNAGVECVGSIEELPLEKFRGTMETNFFGAMRCIQAVVPGMRQRRSGTILNVSSIAGRIAAPPLGAYCASKWALEAMSEVLAGELKTFGIRVALIEPGIIDTDMAQRIGESSSESAYGHSARFAALFSASLQQPVPASLVAQHVLEVTESDSWTLRHLIGPDAAPFVGLRHSMTDEEWVTLNAGDDATFFAKLSGG